MRANPFPVMLIDPHFIIENYTRSREYGLYNMSEFRGEGPVELHTLNAAGAWVPSGEMSASDFIDALNEACRALGPRIGLYFYNQPLDGELLTLFPDVEKLQISSHEFVNAEYVSQLSKLKELTYDAAFCPDPQRLAVMGVERLTDLTIVETPSRKLDLKPLAEAKQLKRLRLMGQYRNVDAIGALTQLSELVLYPARRLDMSFIEDMRGLDALKLAIGALESLESLSHHPTLRDLSFEWVRFLEEIGDLQRFPALERFRLNDQKRVSKLVCGAANTELKHISLGGAPELSEIEGLCELPSLISLSAHSTGLELDRLDLPPSVTHLQVIPKAMKERKAVEDAIKARGLNTNPHRNGDFFYK